MVTPDIENRASHLCVITRFCAGLQLLDVGRALPAGVLLFEQGDRPRTADGGQLLAPGVLGGRPARYSSRYASASFLSYSAAISSASLRLVPASRDAALGGCGARERPYDLTSAIRNPGVGDRAAPRFRRTGETGMT